MQTKKYCNSFSVLKHLSPYLNAPLRLERFETTRTKREADELHITAKSSAATAQVLILRPPMPNEKRHDYVPPESEWSGGCEDRQIELSEKLQNAWR